MLSLIQQCIASLKGCDPILAIPLAMAGATLMLAGWRLWRTAVFISFAMVGAALGAAWLPGTHEPMVKGLVGAVLVAAASLYPTRLSAAVLGGLAGTALFGAILQTIGLADLALWIAMGLLLFAFSALSHVYRRQVVILLTSFEGAMLLLGALFALGGDPNSALQSVSHLINSSRILLPLAVVVPTVVGCTLQMADLSRYQSGQCAA